MSPAERQQRYRARQRQGKVILRVPVELFALADALIEADLLSEAEAANNDRVAAVVAEFLRDLPEVLRVTR